MLELVSAVVAPVAVVAVAAEFSAQLLCRTHAWQPPAGLSMLVSAQGSAL